ncbi:hypothetical protein [Streptomyces thermolilacinus]|uniref:hypothetical protein n=1 Tax=Streptomyces thermolilacinus TaxID=285540 RepID=UPI0033CE2542
MTTDDPTFHAAGAAPGPEQPPDVAASIARPPGAPPGAVPVEAVPLETPRPAPARPAPAHTPPAGTPRRTGGFTPMRSASPSYASATPAHGPGTARGTGAPAGVRTDGARAGAVPAVPALPPGDGTAPRGIGGGDTAHAMPAGMTVTPGGIVSHGDPTDDVTVYDQDALTRSGGLPAPSGTGRPEERPGGFGAPDGITRPVGRDAPVRPTLTSAPEEPGARAGGAETQDGSVGGHPSADAALLEAMLGETTGADAEDADDRADAEDEDSDERTRTLIWTAATYRPLEEVVALVTQLKDAKAVDSPADEALRAAAVARPLDEVRQLVALLNEAGHTLDENDTTLRAAAVGRPIEDVVQLVGILGAAQGRPLSPDAAAPGASTAGGQAVPQDPCLRPPRSATATATATTSATASAPAPTLTAATDNEADGPAQRSGLRWLAAATLSVCGVIHLPRDFAALWSGGYADGLVFTIALLCLVLGEWLIVRETVRVWASAAALSICVVAVHGMAGSSGVALLGNSVGHAWTWAGATAVASAMLTALLAGLALLRRQRKPSLDTGGT